MDRIELTDRDIAHIIDAMTTRRNGLRSFGLSGDGVEETLNKIVKHVGPSTFGGTLTLNTGVDEDNPQFALWFTPAAIRNHFDSDDDEIGKAVEAADDETLSAVGDMAINGDSIYQEFHETLVYCAAYVLLGKDVI